jgi:hypothetical protein
MFPSGRIGPEPTPVLALLTADVAAITFRTMGTYK